MCVTKVWKKIELFLLIENSYLFTTFPILPVLVTQNRQTAFLSLDALCLLERLPNGSSGDLAVFVESKSCVTTTTKRVDNCVKSAFKPGKYKDDVIERHTRSVDARLHLSLW